MFNNIDNLPLGKLIQPIQQGSTGSGNKKKSSIIKKLLKKGMPK